MRGVVKDVYNIALIRTVFRFLHSLLLLIFAAAHRMNCVSESVVAAAECTKGTNPIPNLKLLLLLHVIIELLLDGCTAAVLVAGCIN